MVQSGDPFQTNHAGMSIGTCALTAIIFSIMMRRDSLLLGAHQRAWRRLLLWLNRRNAGLKLLPPLLTMTLSTSIRSLRNGEPLLAKVEAVVAAIMNIAYLPIAEKLRAHAAENELPKPDDAEIRLAWARAQAEAAIAAMEGE